MSQGLPCPNPTCSQLFPPEAVKGAASLTCPKCGHVFHFRGGSAAKPGTNAPTKAAGAAPPAKKAPPPLPVRPASNDAIPTAAAVPVAMPVPTAQPVPAARRKKPEAQSLQFDSEPDMVLSPPRGYRPRGGGAFWKGLAVFVLIAGVLGGVGYAFRDEIGDYFSADPVDRAAQKVQGNFTFRVGSGWRPDVALRDKMRANAALGRKSPRGHAVMYYRDTKTRLLSDAELLDTALRRLRGYFSRFEFVTPFSDGSDGRTEELDGEKAIVFGFSSSVNEVPMRGKAYMLARQGFAYWLMVWGPEEEETALDAPFEAVRAGLKLHNERDGWKPTPRKVQTFASEKGDVAISYPDEVWDKEANPTDADPAAELALLGFEPTEDEETGRKKKVRFAGKAATVVVVVLPAAEGLKEASAAAKAHVEKTVKTSNPDFKFEAVADRPPSEGEYGGIRTRVERFKLVQGNDAVRYGVLQVAARPDAVVAIWGECQYDRRDYWEQEFTEILRTVRSSR